MILTLRAPLQYAQLSISVERSRRHDFQQRRLAQMMRAGAGHQNACAAKQLQSSPVDLFVAADGPVEITARLGESRRVEHNRIELAASGSIARQQIKYVRFPKFNI